MAWFDLIDTCGTQQTISRANSVLNLRTEYKLGKGGFDPTKSFTPQCDCSGFIAWAIGIPRELPPKSGKWLSTDEYWAGGIAPKKNLFKQRNLNEAEVGDLIVYPDSGGSQGHIGLITQIDHSMPSLVIHCSNGNWKHYGDAVRATNPNVFLTGNHKTRIMRIEYDTLRQFII